MRSRAVRVAVGRGRGRGARFAGACLCSAPRLTSRLSSRLASRTHRLRVRYTMTKKKTGNKKKATAPDASSTWGAEPPTPTSRPGPSTNGDSQECVPSHRALDARA
jgi:hypothetical protein